MDRGLCPCYDTTTKHISPLSRYGKSRTTIHSRHHQSRPTQSNWSLGPSLLVQDLYHLVRSVRRQEFGDLSGDVRVQNLPDPTLNWSSKRESRGSSLRPLLSLSTSPKIPYVLLVSPLPSDRRDTRTVVPSVRGESPSSPPSIDSLRV